MLDFSTESMRVYAKDKDLKKVAKVLEQNKISFDSSASHMLVMQPVDDKESWKALKLINDIGPKAPRISTPRQRVSGEKNFFILRLRGCLATVGSLAYFYLKYSPGVDQSREDYFALHKKIVEIKRLLDELIEDIAAWKPKV